MKKLLIYLLMFVQAVGFAQTSFPISTGKIAKNPANKYASLFRYKIKRTNGDTLSQFAWVPTDINGVIVDSRAKRLNGYFASGSTALVNLPATYTIPSTPGPDDFQTQKYIAYMELYPLLDVVKTKAAYDEFVQAGANEIVIPIYWETVFDTYTKQTTNAGSSWSAYDDLITYAKNKGVKVSLRICVDMDDSKIYDLDSGSTGGFYGLSNSAKDEWGDPIRVSYGSGHSSLAYTIGRNMMLDFVNKTLSRYSSSLGTQLLWYSVVMTAQNETGYNYENKRFVGGSPTSSYPATFDYSSHAIAGFRAWLTTKYGTKEALNTSWGTSYGSISEAYPPITGAAVGTATHEQMNALFSTNRGKDFWQYNYKLLRDFMLDCKASGATYATGAKYYLEFGSSSDGFSARRLSNFVSDFSSLSDGMKAQFGAYGNNDLGFSLDVVRSNYANKKSTEVNVRDIIDTDGGVDDSQFHAQTVDEMKTIATALAQSAIRSQAKEIVFIADKISVPTFNAMKEVCVNTKNFLNSYNSVTTTAATVNYNLGEWLESYTSVLNRWKAAGGSTNTRINLVQSSTINYTNNTNPNPLSYSLNEFGYYNFKSNDLKSSQYNSSYDNNRFYILIPTSSITYPSGPLATTNIFVKDLSGVEYLRSTQTQGMSGVGYPNNHPERRYIPTLVEDCMFYLPIQDYDITIVNTGPVSVTFEVYNTDPDQYAVNFQQTVAPGGTYTYRLSSANMNIQPWWKRGIKVNNNKY